MEMQDRTMTVLEALADSRRRLTIREISAMTGVPRSSVHRIVRGLVARRYLVAAVPDGYRIGPGLLGVALSSQQQLVTPMRTLVSSLSDSVQECVDLAVFTGREVVVIDQVSTGNRLRAVTRVGRPFAAHASSIGKVLLAELSDSEIRALLPGTLEKFTRNTITSVGELLREIDMVRIRGIAFDHEEHDLGISAAATSVRGPGGIVQAISIVTGTNRFRSRRADFVQALRAVR
ncbi:IclR family transcriptional regulator [Nocardia sp. NPDC004340]